MINSFRTSELSAEADARQEQHSHGTRQGFRSKLRRQGDPSTKSPPKAVKKWAVSPESMATMAEPVTQPEQEPEAEDSGELQGIDFSE